MTAPKRRRANLKTHCIHGHPLTKANTIIGKQKSYKGHYITHRRCRRCRQEYEREAYRRKRDIDIPILPPIKEWLSL